MNICREVTVVPLARYVTKTCIYTSAKWSKKATISDSNGYKNILQSPQNAGED